MHFKLNWARKESYVPVEKETSPVVVAADPINKVYGQSNLPLKSPVVVPADPINKVYAQSNLPLKAPVVAPADPINKVYGQSNLPLKSPVVAPADPINKMYGQSNLPLKSPVAAPADPIDKVYGQSNLPLKSPVVAAADPIKKVYGQSNLPQKSAVVAAADPVKKVYGQSNLPHNCEAILREADPPISISSVNLSELLRSGVFLKPTKLVKYWVDDRSKSNCFMLFPRTLSITWSDDTNYWAWFPDKESPNETTVEAVELKNVCWLDINGKFDIRCLTPGTLYEVIFKVKLQDPSFGWETPVNLKLVLPNGKYKPQEQKVNLRELPRYKWVDIRVGEFVVENNSVGEITFSMYEHEAGVWKKGLFLKGVAIRPKHTN